MKKKIREILSKLNSINYIMGIYFSIVVLVTISLFMTFSIYYTKETLIENSTDNNVQLVKQVSNSIDGYIRQMEMVMQLLLDNTDVNYFFYGNKDEEVELRIKNIISSIMNSNKEIYCVTLIDKNRDYIVNDGTLVLNDYNNFTNTEWFKNAIDSEFYQFKISSSHVQNAIKGDYKWVITISRKIIDPVTNEMIGIIFMDLNYDVISNLCQEIELGKRGYVYIVNNNMEIIYHPQQKLLLSCIKEELIEEILEINDKSLFDKSDGNKKIYVKYTSINTDWTTIGVSYVEEFIKNQNKLFLEYILLALVLLLSSLLIAWIFADKISRPIKKLKKSIEEVQGENIAQYKPQNEGSTEIISLSNSFKKMLIRIEDLMKQIIKEQKEKRISEMKALQSQINPHFLYNTLYSIIWMVEVDNNDDAILMISSLAKLFRQAIGNSNIYVSISQEIEYTQNYLIIQKMRYRDKIDFEIDVDDEINNAQIIKLILQPIVENALYHGLKYKKSKGLIKIIGYRRKNDVILEVNDNGVGIEEERLKNIFNIKSEANSNGVGLENIQTRLKLTYGEKYGIKIFSIINIGTTVIIKIPYEIFNGGK